MSATTVDSADGDAFRAALGDARSVLLLADDAWSVEDTCTELLSLVDPDDAHHLSVTLEGTPDDRIDHLRTHLGRLPKETGIIAVGETTRSAAVASAPSADLSPVSIDTVSDPSDLTGLAMAIGSYLDAWSLAEETPVVCFDSVTSLLFHADEGRVFRFLHSTTGRLRDAGAVAHYHLNPEVYDEATINAFSALFDAVVQVDADGAVTVRKRR